MLMVWYQNGSSQWYLAQQLGGAATQAGAYYTAVYDTSAAQLVITPTIAGTFRVVIFG